MALQANYEKRFNTLIKSIRSAPNSKTLMVRIRNQLLNVFGVKLATIFLIDGVNKLLVSWILLPGETVRKICIPVTKTSISGYVASTGNKITIHDVYNKKELQKIDPELKFDSSWDRKSGTRTRQILAFPILRGNSKLGVVQLINKVNDKNFDEVDEKCLAELSSVLVDVISNLQKSKKETKETRYDGLVESEIISQEKLDRAFQVAEQKKQYIETVLLEHFRIPKAELGNALARYYHTHYIDLTITDHDPSRILKGINIDYFRNNHLVPLQMENGKVVLASDDPHDQGKIMEVMQILRASQVEVLFALRSDVEGFIDRIKGSMLSHSVQTQNPASVGSLEEIMEKISEDDVDTTLEAQRLEADLTDSRPIVMLVRKIIEDAYKLGASDIHIEPYGMVKDAEVRFRIDGHCKNVLSIPRSHIKPVVARFKVLADLDLSERRKPQDGKIKFHTSEGKDIELRVATLPTADGNEDMVLRVLADSKPMPLDKMMPMHLFEQFKDALIKPFGMILVVGPTGSGKTTTLHSALNYINTPEKKIWTAEDPVEITQYRLRQVQVQPKIGLTFASAMRAFLRADPDVIMVGEMRDQETASMGIEASLTGHLVFSTLHTNSAAETITRLLDMGLDTFNFADALQAILAQRLVRTLCPDCKEAYHPTQSEFEHLMETYGVFFFDHLHTTYTDSLQLYRANGCEKCNDTGYKGRMGVYELLMANRSVRKQIVERAPVDIIKQEAINEGMTTLIQEGIQLVFAGKTDFNQVMSVCAL